MINKVSDYISKLKQKGISFNKIAIFLPKFYKEIEVVNFSENHISIKKKSKVGTIIKIDNKSF